MHSGKKIRMWSPSIRQPFGFTLSIYVDQGVIRGSHLNESVSAPGYQGAFCITLSFSFVLGGFLSET